MYKKLISLSALSLALGLPLAAKANTIIFDGDGGGGDTAVLVDNFDFSPSNVLSDNAIASVTACAPDATSACTVQDPFTVYIQSSLIATTNLGSDTSQPNLNDDGSVAGTDFEITMVMAFDEVVTNAVNTDGDPFFEIAVFGLAPTQTTNYFELWSGTPNHDDLTGSGFNDGTLILSGTIVNIDGTSTFTSNEANIQDFDQFGDGPAAPVNDYPAIDTITGSGSTDTITVMVTSFNSAFFPSLPPVGSPLLLQFDLDLQNVSQQLPFQAVEPSDCFVSSSGGTGSSLCDATFANADGTGINPSLGTINGLNGEDIQFQSDFNLVPRTAVPEPTTLVLLGAGLGVLGLAGNVRRRRRV